MDSGVRFIKFLFVGLILTSVSIIDVKAKTLSKIYEIDYQDSQVLKMYSGGKATVRINSIPYDADVVQVNFSSDNIKDDGHILGHRSLEVNRGAGSNYVEFNIELPELSRADLYKKFKLSIKSFKKNSGFGYQVIEKIENYISPNSCINQKDEDVCGLIKQRCPSGQDCLTVEKTYNNECELDKAGATYLHHGACNSGV
jgi:hypothetical protein